jgi:putative Holliday junction resolvase
MRDPYRGHLLCFDFGRKRIGIAVGQVRTGTATALATAANGKQPDWKAIESIVDEWRPSLMLVGLPLSESGEETPMSAEARSFGASLEKRFSSPVEYCDERLTSVDADRQFAELRAAGGARRKDASRLDAVAARMILENWLQSLPTSE